MPLELRVKVAVVVCVAGAILWGLSWLRFISVALDHGHTAAHLDRQLWFHLNIIGMLDAMAGAGATANVYPVRVMRAALEPYYPKEYRP